MTPQVRTNSSVKGSPLTNEEMDTNLKLIDTQLESLSEGTGFSPGAIPSSALANSGTIAGSYGDDDEAIVLQVNSKGQIVTIESGPARPAWSNVSSVPGSLASFASLVATTDKFPYASGNNTYAYADITAAGRTLLAAGNPAGQREAIGSHNAENLSIGLLPRSRLATGTVINSAYGSYANNSDISTLIPFDDTIPQSTEGTEIITVAITPTRNDTKLRVRASGYASNSVAGNIISGIFRDNLTDALAATASYTQGTADIGRIDVVVEVASNAVTPTIFKLRVGPDTGTMRCNGKTTGRMLGGSSRVTLVVEEIA